MRPDPYKERKSRLHAAKQRKKDPKASSSGTSATSKKTRSDYTNNKTSSSNPGQTFGTGRSDDKGERVDGRGEFSKRRIVSNAFRYEEDGMFVLCCYIWCLCIITCGRFKNRLF